MCLHHEEGTRAPDLAARFARLPKVPLGAVGGKWLGAFRHDDVSVRSASRKGKWCCGRVARLLTRCVRCCTLCWQPFRSSSTVEQRPVKALVVGSNPTSGANERAAISQSVAGRLCRKDGIEGRQRDEGERRSSCRWQVDRCPGPESDLRSNARNPSLVEADCWRS